LFSLTISSPKDLGPSWLLLVTSFLTVTTALKSELWSVSYGLPKLPRHRFSWGLQHSALNTPFPNPRSIEISPCGLGHSMIDVRCFTSNVPFFRHSKLEIDGRCPMLSTFQKSTIIVEHPFYHTMPKTPKLSKSCHVALALQMIDIRHFMLDVPILYHCPTSSELPKLSKLLGVLNTSSTMLSRWA
jgi:hypothetical protein